MKELILMYSYFFCTTVFLSVLVNLLDENGRSRFSILSSSAGYSYMVRKSNFSSQTNYKQGYIGSLNWVVLASNNTFEDFVICYIIDTWCALLIAG